MEHYIYICPCPQLDAMTGGWLLPTNASSASLTEDELECLHLEKIFWPGDGNCYPLLTQGPCPRGAWLVLNNTEDGDMVVCRERRCPCDHDNRDLCEVRLLGS